MRFTWGEGGAGGFFMFCCKVVLSVVVLFLVFVLAI